jgi:hypothetical protein
VLSDTTRSPRADEPARKALVRKLCGAVGTLRFPAQRGASQVTLPLVFERS